MRILYYRAQAKLLQALSEPSFDLRLPNISHHEVYQLSKFQNARGKQKDRYYQVLELIGDAAMYLSVVMVLRDLYLEGSANVFSVSCLTLTLSVIPTDNAPFKRIAVTSNKTFFFLMGKAGLGNNYSAQYSGSLKWVSSGFEIQIGIFVLEEGLPALCKWVLKALGPLMRSCMPYLLEMYDSASNLVNHTHRQSAMSMSMPPMSPMPPIPPMSPTISRSDQ